MPGQPTEQVIGPICLRVWTTADNNGWIEAGNRRWRVQYHPRSRWRNKYDEYCADYWIIGSNGKRHSQILIAPDGSHCTTRSELNAHYQSSHTFSPNRIIKRRRQILDELELTRVDAANLDLHFVPLLEKPKGIHWKTWQQREQIRLGYEFVPVRKPEGMRIKRLQKLIRYLNKHHKPKGTGTDTIAEIDRLFRR
jgi:hypothetical protein